MSLITVLGASGFIGSHLVKKLDELRVDYYAPGRTESLSQKNLGAIIYCVGLTADFRTKPLDTTAAHVCKLLTVIRECQFDSLFYLSSTRLYARSETAQEDDAISINPLSADDLYNISKAMGESLALSASQKTTIIRLSNVYGPDRKSHNFLSDIVRSAIQDRKITLRTSPDSQKDYIDIESVVELLVRMVTNNLREQIYNVASGRNCSNKELADTISALTGCDVDYLPNAPRISYPQIDVSRIRKEFAFSAANVLANMEELVDFYRTNLQES